MSDYQWRVCRDDALLIVARELFGDGVTDAWREVPVTRALIDDTGIDLDEARIFLEFNKSRVITIWASEWGGIEEIKPMRLIHVG